MKKKYIIYILLVLVLIILLCILTCKYYLFTNDTARFHSYLNQADGISVSISDNGTKTISTEILHSEDVLFTEIHNIFRTARLRPSPIPNLIKLLTGNTSMVKSTDTDLSIQISLFQDSQLLHTIFLGGSNVMYFDQKSYFVGDFSNASELQIMNEIMSLFKK